MKVILVDALNTFVIKDQGINSEMFDLLETYLNLKIILTNATDEQIVEFGMTDLPYVLFSLKHEPEKTDPVYFEKMLQNFNLTKDEVVYIEHNIDAVKSAESVGILSYYYDKDNRDLVGLKVFLDGALK